MIPVPVNWSEIAPFAEVIAQAMPSTFENFMASVEEAATTAESLYKSYLLGGELPGGQKLNAPSKAAGTTFHRAAGMMCWAVGNTSDAAKWVEDGQPERDMKLCLPTAPRARKTIGTKKSPSHFYLIIPFRHATSDAKVNAQGRTATGMRAMPKRIYEVAKTLDRSMRVGTTGQRVSATGWVVPAWKYEWNGYISKNRMIAASMDPEAEENRNFMGMVKMGRGGHTSYMTFRIMSQSSPAGSWIRREVQALPALDTAISQALEASEEAMAGAFMADVENLLRS